MFVVHIYNLSCNIISYCPGTFLWYISTTKLKTINCFPLENIKKSCKLYTVVSEIFAECNFREFREEDRIREIFIRENYRGYV